MKAIDLHEGNIVRFEGKMWEVAHKEVGGHGKVGRTVHVKLKDIEGDHTAIQNFRTDEEIEELDASTREMEYSYEEDDFYVFMDTRDYEQYRFSKESIGKKAQLLQENMKIEALVVEDKPRSIRFPETVTLKVTSTPDGVKDVDKEATLENGMTVLVPHFVSEGDEVVVKTEDFSYLERVQ